MYHVLTTDKFTPYYLGSRWIKKGSKFFLFRGNSPVEPPNFILSYLRSVSYFDLRPSKKNHLKNFSIFIKILNIGSILALSEVCKNSSYFPVKGDSNGCFVCYEFRIWVLGLALCGWAVHGSGVGASVPSCINLFLQSSKQIDPFVDPFCLALWLKKGVQPLSLFCPVNKTLKCWVISV